MKFLNITIFSRFFLLLSLCLPCVAYTQNMAELSSSEPFVASLRLAPDSTEHDLLLEVSFDEVANKVTLSLESKSYMLFAFQRSVVYNKVFSCCNTLRPDKLPYKVLNDPPCKFRISQPVRASLGDKFRKFQFLPWIDYDGMERLPDSNQLAADKIVQSFSVSPKQKSVSFTLQDLFAIRREGASASSFIIFAHRNINEEYVFTLHRNPCLGLDSLVDSMTSVRNALRASLKSLTGSLPDGAFDNVEAFLNYYSSRDAILIKYPKLNFLSDCPSLNAIVASYNASIDSLLHLHPSLELPQPEGDLVTSITPSDARIDASALMFKARQLDELIVQWQYASNRVQRLNIEQRCEKLIREGSDLLIGHRVVDDDDRRVLKIFRDAVAYYNKVCK